MCLCVDRRTRGRSHVDPFHASSPASIQQWRWLAPGTAHRARRAGGHEGGAAIRRNFKLDQENQETMVFGHDVHASPASTARVT